MPPIRWRGWRDAKFQTFAKHLLLISLNDVTKIPKAARLEHANARMIMIVCGVMEHENDELQEFWEEDAVENLVTFFDWCECSRSHLLLYFSQFNVTLPRQTGPSFSLTAIKMPIGLEAIGSNFLSFTSVGLSYFAFFRSISDFSDNVPWVTWFQVKA